jgi:hypothetical protein
MSEKILFLDIDGVLNRIGGDNRTTRLIRRLFGLEEGLVRNLERVLDQDPEIKVVISSAWRRGDMPRFYEDLKLFNFKHTERVQEMTPHLPCATRHLEIKKYLEDVDHENYIVIDDYDFSEEIPDGKFLWTPSDLGLDGGRFRRLQMLLGLPIDPPVF